MGFFYVGLRVFGIGFLVVSCSAPDGVVYGSKTLSPCNLLITFCDLKSVNNIENELNNNNNGLRILTLTPCPKP